VGLGEKGEIDGEVWARSECFFGFFSFLIGVGFSLLTSERGLG
jgi:hypothetical protein